MSNQSLVFDLLALAMHFRRKIARMRHDLSSHLAAGRLSLPIDRSFPLDEAAHAMDRMASNAHFGKVVLSLT